MKKKQILIDGSIVSYYENLHSEKTGVFVFLHGWMQDGKSFHELFELFDAKKIPYISLDLPGFGTSGLAHNNMTIEEYGDIVKKCIEKLGLEKPTLVGHSFGGRISMYLGSFYENIEKIILIGAAGIAPKMNPLNLFIVKTGKLVFSLPGLKSLGKKVKDSASGSDYKTAGNMENIFRNTISNDLQHYMKKVMYPTLMIWGDTDDQVPLDEAQIMQTHIKHSKLHVLSGTHFIHKEQPNEIMNLILDFRTNCDAF